MADKQEFEVKVRDRHEDKVFTVKLGENEHITSQEKAEVHVFTMPASMGGKHPGLDVSPKDQAKFDAELAKWKELHPKETPKGEAKAF